MRIIAGQFRGRKLLPPEGQATRPITDRVKQSLFDIITPLLPDAVVYDLFAGTGSLGLEALSRGAQHAIFFEMDRSAAQLLRRNVEVLKVEDNSIIRDMSVFDFFRAKPEMMKAGLVFLDPPYRFLREQANELRWLAATLAESYLLPGATVVFRHDAQDTLDLPPLIRYDQRAYGGMELDLLR